MKKSIFSFIIPLALFSLASFAVVGVPERVGAQVSPVLGSFAVFQFSPTYTSTTTGNLPNTTIYSVLGFSASAQGSDITLERVRIVLGTNRKILDNASTLYITDKYGTPLASSPINPNNVVLDGNNYIIQVTFSVFLPRDTSSAFVIAVDKANPDADFSIPVNGIRGIDTSGVNSFAPVQVISNQAFINLLSPNGGETVPAATALPVVWTESNVVNPIIIRITDSAGKEFYSGKTSGVVGKNMQTLQPEATNVPPGKYKVTVCYGDGLPFEPCDSSDDYFAIGAATPCYTFVYNLTLGSRDTPGRRDDVTHLQNFLLAKGFTIKDLTLDDPADKGYFGFATFQALKRYQTSVGIQATGYFGPETRAKVNGECGNGTVPVAPTVTLSLDPASPLASTVVAGTDGTLSKQAVLVFDLKSPNTKDAVLKNVSINLSNPGNVTTAYLYQGSTLVDSASVSNGIATFSNINQALPVSVTMPFVVKLDINGITTGSINITPSVSSLDVTDIKGISLGIVGKAIGNTINITSPTLTSSATITSASQTTSLTPTITGTATGVTSVIIVLTKNGGIAYGSATLTVNGGTWSTTVSPALVSGQYKVIVYDEIFNLLTTGNLSVGVDQPFIITPNGGTFQAGSTLNIQWTVPGLTQQNNSIGLSVYQISLGPKTSILSKAVGNPVSNGQVSASGSYSWTIPTTAPAGTDYVVYLGTGSTYTESNPFKITSSSIPATASITSSSRTTSLTPTITGTASGVSAVGLTLSSSGGKVYGSGLIPVTSGKWSTTVSPALVSGQYTVTVYDANNKVLTTGILTVVASAQPSITVLSPNGGENFDYNSQIPITWSSSGWKGNEIISVKFVFPDGFICSQGETPVSNNSYYMVPPNSAGCLDIPTKRFIEGTYKVRLVVRNSLGVELASDDSNSVFNIVKAASIVKITSPITNAILKVGDVYTINWSSINLPSDSKIMISLFKSGTAINKIIVQDLPASQGTYAWKAEVTTGWAFGFETTLKYKVAKLLGFPIAQAGNDSYNLVVSAYWSSGSVGDSRPITIVTPVTQTITVLPWTASSTDGFTSVLAGNYLGYSLNWSGGPMGDPNYMIFVHFVNRITGVTTFWADINPTTPVSSWSGNISTPNGTLVPANTPPGTYDVYVGIYRGPTRLALTAGTGVIAENDGGVSMRYKVGSINVTAATATANVSSAGLPLVRTPNASASIWNALKSLFVGQ